jgi:excisionase family DNA binding protein
MTSAPSTQTIPHSADSDPWLTVAQVSAYVQTHGATVRRACRDGRLRHARVGTRHGIRVRRSWVDAWLEASTTPIEQSMPVALTPRRASR